jgi:hypothetical protein
VRERVAPVLVQRVVATRGTTRGRGDVLCFPATVDQPEVDQSSQRLVHRALGNAEVIGDLESVELGLPDPVTVPAGVEHLRVESEQESTSGLGHRANSNSVSASEPRFQ